MKRNTDFMLRDIAGEVILVPTGAATQQFNGMITLNEVAAFIWKNLDESKSKEELVDKIMDEFEVDVYKRQGNIRTLRYLASGIIRSCNKIIREYWISSDWSCRDRSTSICK